MSNHSKSFLSAGAVVLLALLAYPAVAAPPGGTPQDAKTVAKVLEVEGALLGRTSPNAAWQPFKAGTAVAAETLLVALPGTNLLSKNEAVRLRMLADLGKRGPFPVFESGIRLHDNAKVDLDFTLDRGIVAVVNMKTKGSATVRIRLHHKTFDLTLKEHGATVGMEIYGRHPPGKPTVTLNKQGQVTSKDYPTRDLVMLVVKGEATLNADGNEYALNAPPGPAMLQWDNVSGRVALTNLEKLPVLILPTGKAEEQYFKDVCARAQPLMTEPLAKLVATYRASKVTSERKAVAVLTAALDDLPGLLQSLEDAHNAEVRDFSVTVLRNWIGRQTGQVEQLFDTLIKHEKYTPAQAKTFVHLLYGATEAQKKEPALYEVLISLLGHSKLPIREMARWHLVRLAPAGKKIDYDAAAPVEQRQKAIAQWRTLIPEGQLPPPVVARPLEKK